ncbi:MAG: hypothetical protein ACRERX_22800 [Pseudomonas sp.]
MGEALKSHYWVEEKNDSELLGMERWKVGSSQRQRAKAQAALRGRRRIREAAADKKMLSI